MTDVQVARADGALWPILHGAPRPLRILLRTRAAAYLGDEDPVAVLVESHGLLVPDAIVLPPSTRWTTLLSEHETTGAPILLGDGRLRCGAAQISLTDRLDLRVTLSPPPIERVRRAVARLDEALGAIRTTDAGLPRLTHRWSSGRADPATLAHDAPRLIGRGPGLTPSGDDLLAAAIFTHTVLGTAGAAHAAERIIGLSAGRTTAASIVSLRGAATARAVPQLGAALSSLLRDDDPTPAVADVLALGHSSGADLARGMHDALAATLALSAERKVS